MEDKKNDISEKTIAFFRKSFQYYGKEIALQSNQHFSIDQICDEEKEQQGIYNYHIQYGFPSSGCVSMDFSYSQDKDSFSIDKITIYATPADKELIMATFTPQSQIGEINIRANIGIDMETYEHTSIGEIEANPNALGLLDIAINDLSQAEVLGECIIGVPVGSKLIPCSRSTISPKNKGKSV